MKTFLLLSAFTLILPINFGCKKDKSDYQIVFDQYGLPTATTAGLNIMAYQYQQKPFYIHKRTSTDSLHAILIPNQDDSFSFELSSTIKVDNADQALFIYLDSLTIDIGKKIALTSSSANGHRSDATLYQTSYHTLYGTVGNIYKSFDTEPGFIIFNYYDKKNKVLSGVFEVTVKSLYDVEPRLIQIEKGRFDVKYRSSRFIIL